ncbi:MAG: hypothetical protein L0312_31260 [Acidobacteria bacterium]|nr:hypothetical protein [Acidobacteriota bacterium]
MASETVREGLSRYIDGRIRTHTADEIADGILARYIVLTREDLEAVIPDNWLDPLLSGVLTNLRAAIRERVQRLQGLQQEEVSESHNVCAHAFDDTGACDYCGMRLAAAPAPTPQQQSAWDADKTFCEAIIKVSYETPHGVENVDLLTVLYLEARKAYATQRVAAVEQGWKAELDQERMIARKAENDADAAEAEVARLREKVDLLLSLLPKDVTADLMSAKIVRSCEAALTAPPSNPTKEK